MKNYINYVIVLVGLMTSCGDPDYPTPTPSVGTLTGPKLTVVHVFPTAPKAKITVDNVAAAKDTVRYEKAVDNKLYNTTTLTLPAGPNRYIMYSDLLKDTLYVKERITATSGTNNTTFLSFEVKGVDTLARAVRVADDLALPDVGFAKIRFLNFSGDAGEVKLTDVGGATTVISGRKFREISRTVGNVTTDFARFTSVPAGTYSYEVRTVTGDEVLVTINSLKLDSKGIYTIYIKGWVDVEDDRFLIDYGTIKH